MAKQNISITAFKEAREKDGLTVAELSTKFGISQANVKQIIEKLELSKRPKRVGYTLVDDSQTNTTQA